MANTTTNGESIAPRPMQQRKRTASEFGIPVLTSLPHVATRRHESGNRYHRVDEVELPQPYSRRDQPHPDEEISSPTLKLTASVPTEAPELDVEESEITLGVHNPDVADVETEPIPEADRLSEVAYNWIAKLSVTTIAIVILLYVLKGMKQQEAVPVPDGAWDSEPIRVTDVEENPFSSEAQVEPVVTPQAEVEETTQSGPMFIDPSSSPTEILESTPFPAAPDESEFAGMDLEAPVETIESKGAFADLKPAESTPIASSTNTASNPAPTWTPPASPARSSLVESQPSNTGGASSIVYPSTGFPEFGNDSTVQASAAGVRTPQRPAHSARIQLNGTIQKFKR